MPYDQPATGASDGAAPGQTVPAGQGRPVRIALFGQFGMGNLGNDASLEAMIRGLRSRLPEASIAVICSCPDAVRATFNVPAIAWTRMPARTSVMWLLNRLLLRVPNRVLGQFRAMSVLTGFDILLVPGTGFLDDFGERAFGLPLTVLQWMLAAKMTGRRIVMASIGIGPIRSRLSRRLMLTAAWLSNFLSVRDVASQDYVRAHMPRLRPPDIRPDLAFSLPVPPQPSPEALQDAPIALGVMRYRGWSHTDGDTYRTYIDKLAAFARNQIEAGRRIRLVIGEDSDEVAVQDLRAALAHLGGEAMLSMVEYTPARTVHDVMQQMATAEIAIVTRFHNLVGALMVGTPVISLGYARKNDVLLADVGLSSFAAHVETFDLAWLSERMAALRAGREGFVAGIGLRIAAYRHALAGQMEAIATLIDARAVQHHQLKGRAE